MEKAVKLTLIILAVLVCGCAMKSKKEKNEDYEVYVNQIIESFSKEMQKEFGLVCYGYGGSMPYDVEEIAIKFSAYQRASIEEARILEVKVTERFLKAINSHEKIRPFLREYPFNSDRGKVSISFKKPNHNRYNDGSVAYVTQFKNKISYCAEDESPLKLALLKEEPYEDALKIVEGGSSDNQTGK